MKSPVLLLIVLLSPLVSTFACDSESGGTPIDTHELPSEDMSADDHAPDTTAPVDSAVDSLEVADALDEVDEVVEPPACPVEHLYDPLAARDLDLFPDDFLTRPEAESPTGLVLDFDPAKSPWLETVPELFQGNLEGQDYITGFARNGKLFMRFSGPIGALPSMTDSTTNDVVLLLDLGQDPPARVPFAATTNDRGRGLFITPMTTLRPGALHALVVTDALAAEDGGCIGRSAVTDALLRGDAADPRFSGLLERTRTLLDTGLVDAERIVAMNLFTTHRDTHLLEAIAADIQGRSFTWSGPIDCTRYTGYEKCETSFVAWDYRDGNSVRSAQPTASWTIPVSVWLPTRGKGPFPTVVIGHGMQQDRHVGDRVATAFTEMGVAMVGIDSLHHGAHPTADQDPENDAILFLGLDFDVIRIDGKLIRGNFVQSTLDRVQLVELLQQAPDIDGDGAADIDSSKLLYLGPSLGGMIGAGVMALRNDIEASIFSVSGGNLINFVLENEMMAGLKALIAGLAGSEARFDRLAAAMQSVVDGGDPATLGAHILYDRLDRSSTPPHVLFNVAIRDTVVPPSAGKALARAMQIPHVGPVLDPLDFVPRDETMPAVGNLHGGTTTAGFFQFDRVTRNGGVVEVEHATLTLSPEGLAQELHFMETWLAGIPEIIDPYALLGTGPLPAAP